ncbi:MAG: hypothetical protein WCH99_11720 [Verrucomicrobiota bacterium]
MEPPLKKAFIPRRVKLAALWLSISLSLYVLSTGPVFRLSHDYGVPTMEFVDFIYKPIELLNNHCPPFKNFIRWYGMEIWNPNIPLMK